MNFVIAERTDELINQFYLKFTNHSPLYGYYDGKISITIKYLENGMSQKDKKNSEISKQFEIDLISEPSNIVEKKLKV